jgi:hypothetical protein
MKIVQVSAIPMSAPIGKNNTVGDQPFESCSAIVGEGANDFAIVVPVVRKAVRLDYRPIGEIAEH